MVQWEGQTTPTNAHNYCLTKYQQRFNEALFRVKVEEEGRTTKEVITSTLANAYNSCLTKYVCLGNVMFKSDPCIPCSVCLYLCLFV